MLDSTIPLRSKQRKTLRAKAHGLKPVVQIGRRGLTEAVMKAIQTGLEDHELIKIRFDDFQDDRDELCQSIETILGAATVGRIGHIVILYRPHPDPEKRRIHL